MPLSTESASAATKTTTSGIPPASEKPPDADDPLRPSDWLMGVTTESSALPNGSASLPGH
jgi:hypothetical protein